MVIQRPSKVLAAIDDWWQEGSEAPIYPGALLLDDDTIRENVVRAATVAKILEWQAQALADYILTAGPGVPPHIRTTAASVERKLRR